ncbi:MAG: DR2241 family protein [Limisphaerales bacterium]
MAVVNNPALAAFCAAIGSELVLAQVLVRRETAGFELRHISDRNASANDLKSVANGELRALASHTTAGQFRPIKAAPNLRAGWLCRVASDAELELTLNQLYPGAIADWFAAQEATPPVTHYRDFTARQTGMYRITTMLTDAQAGQIIRACCDARFCLKRRLWTVDGLPPDAADAKSLIPCLEPCAVLMEFARKAVRIEQEEAKSTLTLAPSEVASLLAALDSSVARPPASQREADLSTADNPRRLQLLREKLQGFAPVAPATAQE